MEITKEQEARILKLDPNFFEVKLEIGNWYRCTYTDVLTEDNLSIIYVIGNNKESINGFGFNYKGNWFDEKLNCGSFGEYYKLATYKEVKDALNKEVVKRGYAKDNFISLSSGRIADLDCLTPKFSVKSNRLWTVNGLVFQDGIWATKIETITKAEA